MVVVAEVDCSGKGDFRGAKYGDVDVEEWRRELRERKNGKREWGRCVENCF